MGFEIHTIGLYTRRLWGKAGRQQSFISGSALTRLHIPAPLDSNSALYLPIIYLPAMVNCSNSQLGLKLEPETQA